MPVSALADAKHTAMIMMRRAPLEPEDSGLCLFDWTTKATDVRLEYEKATVVWRRTERLREHAKRRM
jgi:hypothetical protein